MGKYEKSPLRNIDSTKEIIKNALLDFSTVIKEAGCKQQYKTSVEKVEVFLCKGFHFYNDSFPEYGFEYHEKTKFFEFDLNDSQVLKRAQYTRAFLQCRHFYKNGFYLIQATPPNEFFSDTLRLYFLKLNSRDKKRYIKECMPLILEDYHILTYE